MTTDNNIPLLWSVISEVRRVTENSWKTMTVQLALALADIISAIPYGTLIIT